MSEDPFRLPPRSVVSFSGGRTSAYLLHRVMLAHGGALPDDVIVTFANTGREMPATLDFVRDVGAAWGVPIHWLEWRKGRPGFEEVSHNSAARDGEPFAALIRYRKYLPNPHARFCTQELKIRVMGGYSRTVMGWERWTNAVGLRADEPNRVAKATDPDSWRDRWQTVAPLAVAGITRDDVLAFWRAQPFDLRLAGAWEGNCDGCFMKGRGALSRMFRDHPDRMAWWPDQETAMTHSDARRTRAVFHSDRGPLAVLRETAERQGVLPFSVFDDQTECEWACTD